MKTLVRTAFVCRRCYVGFLYVLTWKLAKGEPTFESSLCESCDMMWEF